jgi:hypothetical protein
MNSGRSPVSMMGLPRSSARLAALLLALLVQCGCINALVMANRIVFGDPKHKSAFEVATGINLKEKGKRVLLHCSALSFIAEEHGTLSADVQA